MPGFNRSGGNLTITAAGGGFRRFTSTDPTVLPVDPIVKIAAIDFAVNLVTSTTINGNVQRAGPDISSCAVEGQTPCKFIKVINPGGRSQDKAISTVALYNLLPGPAPIPQGLNANNGLSVGGTDVTVTGVNLDFVVQVTLNGKLGAIDQNSRSETSLKFTTPANCPMSFPLVFVDVDNGSTSFGSFIYSNSILGPILDGFPPINVGLGKTASTLDAFVRVGPCEFLQVTNPDQTGGCLSVSMRSQIFSESRSSRQYAVSVSADASNCKTIAEVKTYNFSFTLNNGPRNGPVKAVVNVK